MAAKCMYLGFISIVFFAQSTVTNSVLQAMGKVMAPVINATLALVIHVVVLVVMLYCTDWALYALVFGSIVNSLLICIFNQRSLTKYKTGKMDNRRIYVAPTIASIFMGVVTIIVYEGCRKLLGNWVIAMFVAVFVAIIFYAVAILKAGGYTEEELLNMPKGGLIVRFAKKFRLIK